MTALLGLAALGVHAARAEPTEPLLSGKSRFALVIGEADYRNARLITATKDAASLVQVLTNAGFRTDGGADLEQHLIREKVRSLVDLASRESNVETILVYIAGRVAQINGENVILPVGAPIDRASDVVLNGFRLNDLINTLKLVPAKARIIMLDAGAPPDALKADRHFSPGLAIVEAPEGFLISFNQDPGRSLIEPQPPMGLFLKGMLDALQQPVASYADTFALARQRVVDESGNQQKPWTLDRITDQSLAFYPPPPGVMLPSIAHKDGAKVQLDSLTREDAFRKVIASDNILDYQAFLVKFPKDEAVPTIQYNLAVRREAEVWARALRDNTAEGYWTYISTYPDGGNVEVARQKLALMGVSAEAPTGFKGVSYADLPPPLPGIEMIASSASMPIDLMPRAPSLRLPPVAAVVAAAVAAPLAVSLGKRLPQISAPLVRPAWAARMPSAASRVSFTPPGLRPAPTGSPGNRPSFQPLRPSRPAPQGFAAPPRVTPTPGGRPSIHALQPPGTGSRLRAAPQMPGSATLTIQRVLPVRPVGAPVTTAPVTAHPGPITGGMPRASSRGPIVAPQRALQMRAPVRAPMQAAPRQFQRPVYAPRMQMPQAPRVAAPVQRRPTCVSRGGRTFCR